MLFFCPRVPSICAYGLRIPSAARLPKVLEYRVLAAPLLVRIKLVDVDLHNQLKRNGNSIGSNIAEGASEDRPKVKADRYRIAKREAEEAGTNWESAVASGYLTMKEIDPLLKLWMRSRACSLP